MKEKNSEQYGITLYKFVHFSVVLLIFFIGWILFRYETWKNINYYAFRYNFYVLAGYSVLLFFLSRTYNAYLLGYTRIRSLVFAQFLSQFFAAIIIWIVVCVAWKRLQSPWYLFAGIVLQLIWDAAWSFAANNYYCKMYPLKKTLLIYRSELDKRRFGSIQGRPCERIYQITEQIQYQGTHFEDIADRLDGFDAVFVAGIDSGCRNGIAKYCKENNVTGFFLPHIGDVIMQEAKHIQSFDTPVLCVTRTVVNPEFAFVKRAFDLITACVALIILSPLMLLTAAAIHFYDGGPAIYRQIRLTKDGREFEIYKFRSMRVDAEKDGRARLSTGENDDRITPIGKIVRKIRFDELPQLWNIAKGDMSFVGPRPERPEIAEQYYENLPDFRLRLQVKAGLTGYAQVYGKYNTEPYEKLEFDLLYINNMNILTDIGLLFSTFRVLFSKESTEGVKEGQVTAIATDKK